MLEVNPRASRTVPFVAKATGVPVAKIAAKVMAGVTLAELGMTREPIPSHVSREGKRLPVLQVRRRRYRARPRNASTGEVMGISERFTIAFAKSQLAAGTVLPSEGKIFVSVAERHKDAIVELARRLVGLGLFAARHRRHGRRAGSGRHPRRRVKKIAEGQPNLLDYLNDATVALVINTPSGKGARTDEGRIRAAAVQLGVPCITTLQAAEAAVKAMEALREEEMEVQALQDGFRTQHSDSIVSRGCNDAVCNWPHAGSIQILQSMLLSDSSVQHDHFRFVR